MEILGSLIIFILFMFLYMIIVEIFVVLFRITGLTDEKARFQVISMLTNSGYTTKEAELISTNQRRRKLARFVMMFGYAFTVTIVSTVVNIFYQFTRNYDGGALASLPIIGLALLLSWWFKRSRWTNASVDKLINIIANKLSYEKDKNPIIIIDDYGSIIMAKIPLYYMPPELDGIELQKSNIKSTYGINVILRKTKTQEFLPQGDTIFNLGDTIVVMGEEKNIRKVFGIKGSDRKERVTYKAKEKQK